MSYNCISNIVKYSNLLNEKTTLLGIGPMSKTVIDAALESAIENDFPLFFIASRNQIEKKDLGSGYVESWDQFGVGAYIEKRISELNYTGPVYICRDHGGPWQNDKEYSRKISFDEAMKNSIDSFVCDLNAGFSLLHIDTSKDPNINGPVPYDIAISRVLHTLKKLEEYKFTYHLSGNIYEVSLEETTDNYSSISEFKCFIELLMKDLNRRDLPRPVFIVGNTGTLTRMDKNVGIFDPDTVLELKSIADKYNMIFKEHNADYLDTRYLKMHPELGIGMANVAPEFAKLETEALIKLAQLEEDFILNNNVNISKSNFSSIIFSNILKSGKWVKWLSDKGLVLNNDSDSELKKVITNVNGHYFYHKEDVSTARNILFDNVRKLGICHDPSNYLKVAVKNGIQRYVYAFNLKSLTSKIADYRKFESKVNRQRLIRRE
jgi:D-tagatose-1,6-bisphosphate aldolase subunit GatZ/KbaZ